MIFLTLSDVEKYYTQYGFNKCADNVRGSEFLLQKKIQIPSIINPEIIITKFVITIYVYDFSKYSTTLGIQMAAEVQYETIDGYIVNVSLSLDRKNYDIDSIEGFFLEFYEKFECREDN